MEKNLDLNNFILLEQGKEGSTFFGQGTKESVTSNLGPNFAIT